MSDSFKALKANRNSRLKKLQAKLDEESSGGNRNQDERLWVPPKGKDGNGFAVIRFLPAAKDSNLEWVRVWRHAFKGPTGKWYVENCLTTLGKKDPVVELNSRLWDSGSKEEVEQVRAQKRKVGYVSNIYVVKDPARPENEGKVFLFKYGVKIWDKINAAMNPPEHVVAAGKTGFNPFDMWEGANFNLVVKQVSGFNNYDDSTFDSPAPLKENDKELETIWLQEYALDEFLAPDQFKTYSELKAQLDEVLGGDVVPVNSTADKDLDLPKNEPDETDDDVPFDIDDDSDEDYEKLLAS